MIDPQIQEAREQEFKEEELRVITELKLTLVELQLKLSIVQEDVLAQSALKATTAAADRSIDVLKSIAQPVMDIQTVFESLEQKEGVQVTQHAEKAARKYPNYWIFAD